MMPFRECARLSSVFKNLPLSKSAGKKCALFVSTGGLSVTFSTVFKMCRHRVNAVLKGQGHVM